MKFITKFIKRPPSIVAIGGGTGMASLLRGLKEHTDKITAVVTVADDGGSSGRLRKDFDILPPGDIRNCLVALADVGPVLEELFQYRFTESDLRGHSFGNLFLAALTRITGDFSKAVEEANRILNVRGRVLPATLTKVALVAHHSDGTKSTGESLIGRGRGKWIERISLKPEPEPASKEIINAIEGADMIVLGPGSLYTSVIPNLLISGILPAIADAPAIKAYVCNIMTQPGETGGYTAADHVDALLRHATPNMLDFAVFRDGLGQRR
ncbi:MAG: YvcK family protein [Planctomycetes bacterium]|nr:YvcK family protein [Planctomycetota bacterium]